MSISVTNTSAGLSNSTILTEEDAATIEALHTFDRGTNAPFAVAAGSAVVANLDADKVDGYEASALAVLAENETVTGNWTFSGTITHSGFHTNSAQPRCSAHHDTTQAIGTSAFAAMSLNQESFDVGSMHDNASNNTRLTIPAGAGGLYYISAAAFFAANSTGVRAIKLRKNGSTDLNGSQRNSQNAGASEGVSVQTDGVFVLSAADYVEAPVYQNSGGNLNIGSASDDVIRSTLMAMRVW